MNQALSFSWVSISAVPVLAQTVSPLTAADLPVPPVTTARMYSRTVAAVCASMAVRYTAGSKVCRSAPSAPTARSSRRGSIITPSLATAAATMHMCSGVTASWF